MIWFTAMDPTTHLDHWSDHRFRFKDNQALFFATTCAVIAFGPISILFLLRLEEQVKAVEEKDGKVELFWRGEPLWEEGRRERTEGVAEDVGEGGGERRGQG